MNTSSKRYIFNFVVFSIGYILLGFLLLFAPEESKRIICYLLGSVAILLGIFRIVWHFKKDDVSRAFHNDIPFGVVLLIAGLYLIMRPDALWAWLPVILGFAVVFDSIVKLQHAFDLRRMNFSHWWGIFALAIGTMVLGILLILDIFGANILLYYFGIVLVVDGFINIGTIILVYIHAKKSAQSLELPEKPESKNNSDIDL